TDDLSQSLDLFTLGAIGRMKGKEYEDKLVTLQDPFAPASEEYRKIRSNMQFLSVDQAIKSIMITSSNPGEGKSITAANLGVVMAQTGLKIILVDTDLRRPVLHEIFQIPNLGGVTELLCSPDLKISSQLRKTHIENLQVITCGVIPPNPSELLASRRMGELIANLNELADIVLYDSPPLLPVTDASVLSHRIERVVLIVQAGKTRRKIVKRALLHLKRADANVLGVVFNKVSGQGEDQYSYYHYYTPNGHNQFPLPAQAQPERRRHRLPFLK
ncbi:MAG: CpsD/CapB family tyrosine-protein kinase, partial [Nitrospira sp.]|nr:CpsD/CapB family tyrosine-protein kinase [Nitrospira sp.]